MMHALPIQSRAHTGTHLNAWFQYSYAHKDGFDRLHTGLAIPIESNYRATDRKEHDLKPLTLAEQHRWKTLERKAMQENLSGQDLAEYESLIAIQFYHRLKKEEPHLSHMELLEIVQQTIG